MGSLGAVLLKKVETMDKTLRAFFIGAGFAIGACLIAAWQPIEVTTQRIGYAVIVVGAMAALPWIAEYILDRWIRAAKLYGFFVQFMWDRMQQEKKTRYTGDTPNSND